MVWLRFNKDIYIKVLPELLIVINHYFSIQITIWVTQYVGSWVGLCKIGKLFYNRYIISNLNGVSAYFPEIL